MKTAGKITLSIFSALVLLIAAAFIWADVWVSDLVQREVKNTFSGMEGCEASVGDINLFFFSGTAVVKDIHFTAGSIELDVPSIVVGRVSYSALLKGRLWVHFIRIDSPRLSWAFDEKAPEKSLPNLQDTTLANAGKWLQNVELRHLIIDDASASIRSTKTPLKVQVDSLDLHLRDLAYSFVDSVFEYNDSVYDLSLEALSVKTPDGLFAVDLHDLETEDQGPLHLGATRFRHTISPRALADRVKEPVTWVDVRLNSLSTSPLNPIRKVLAKDWTLESIKADVALLHASRDARYAPKKPFHMPQWYLRSIPAVFIIHHVNASVQRLDVEFASTNINCGEMHLANIRAHMDNVTNKPGAVWHNTMRAPVGEKGHAQGMFNMYMDKTCTFNCALQASNIETNYLNSFIRPLVGITCDCHIDSLDTRYGGDSTIAHGSFCMEYHGLKVKVHKEDDIPYKIVTKHANTFTTLANTLIPKSNPTAVDPAPRSYQVSWKRDPWSPVELYIFGPCINGVVETMLPGLYVHKQEKKKK